MIGSTLFFLTLAAQPAPPPPPFTARCATCHGDEARGSARGPGLVMNPRVAVQSIDQLRAYLVRGNAGAGMPAFADLPADELLALARYLRRINVETIVPPPAGPSRSIPFGPPQPGDWRTNNGNDSDNLYTNCVLALDAATGALKWHYQFTPHDVADRDATEPNVLVDRVYRGKPSKLLLHADRNGFFYVLDRTSGAVLLARPFLRRVDWASGIGADGRPMVKDPRGCPVDAANWSSTAFSPETGLYYFLALEECVGKPTGYPDQTGQRFLRAVNIETGEIAWEVPQPGPARAKTWSGVLATAAGLLFYGQPNGGFVAVDQRDGRTLWQFPTNVRMKASPMTFGFGGQQYVVVAAGPNILCFGL
jgi:glucose dehydrogenase